MRSLRFGIEIETIGQTRETIAHAIQAVVGGEVGHLGGSYGTWTVTDRRGRVWKAVADASLSADQSRQAEVVSPILEYDDITELQQVARALREAGASVDPSCGIHVHVDSSRFDVKSLMNLAKLVHQQEDLIVAALGVRASRLQRYTRMLDGRFVAELERRRPRCMADLNRAWYGHYNARPAHYDGSRYHGLNLHSVWYRGTIEYRYFEGTLHAGKIRAYVQFCLALTAKALASKSAISRKRRFNPATGRYDFRVFLLRLGMIGDEFKTARHHLLAGMQGSAAWKHTGPERPAQGGAAAAATPGAAAAAPTADAEVA